MSESEDFLHEDNDAGPPLKKRESDEPPLANASFKEDLVCCKCSKLPYVYKSLDKHDKNIRVLQRVPRSFRFNLLEILIDSTDSSSHYDALSYTWAPELPRTCIEVDGCCLVAGANLVDALRYVRCSGLLWVDAICINQRDVDERGHQVNIMRQIYTSAEKVHVWLGIGVRDSLRIGRGSFWEGKERPEDSQRKILSSPWFNRTWVLQEVVHAKSISLQWRKRVIEWDELQNIARSTNLQNLPTSERSLGTSTLIQQSMTISLAMDRWRTERQRSNELCSTRVQVEDAVYDARYSGWKDPRDKIFAVLSLSPKANGDLLLTPNYRLSPRETQILLASSSILAYENLNILRYVKHSGRDILLPSWAPRWSFGETIPVSQGGPFSGADITRTRAKAEALVSDDSQCLHLRGHFLLEVEHIYDNAVRRPTKYANSICFSINEEGTARRSKQPSNPMYSSDFLLLYVDALPTPGLLLFLDFESPLHNWFWQFNSPEDRMRGNYIAITHQDCGAIVPSSTQPGDLIVALLGIRLLFVIRRCPNMPNNEDGSAKYLIIGACKVNGDMDWEKFEESTETSTPICFI
ncbi:hypothetical protein N7G274_008953 [Stereocaulon virgatum]|uniref:Heterokaryon incompatibility domain-containing protein n=1 Tax=Stereocaulon virgatum TaxID=373712 RepID=A0ABR3ZYK2_9LECA